MNKKILGLDLGTNSIGFSLVEKYMEDNQTIFKEIVSNSVIFSGYIKAEDRRNFRSSRRRNERKSRRNKIVRKLLHNFGFADISIINKPIEYFNIISKNKNPYTSRYETVSGKNLSKDEFVFALYSIITRRGYSNQFKTDDKEEKVKENEVINSAISQNKEIYHKNNLELPSLVLSHKKELLEKQDYINVALRNKKDNYNNSLDRELWKEELIKLLDSQKDNRDLFQSKDIFEEFQNKLINGVNENSIGVFEQRALQSMEDMVGFCSFYNKYHEDSQKRVSKSHISSIELTLRQRIENSILGNLIFNKKTGELYIPSKDEIDNTIEFWLKMPKAQTINVKNIFDKAGLKNIIIKTANKQDETLLDIKLHFQLVKIFRENSIDIYDKDRDLYSKIIEILHYYVNKQQIIKEIKKIDIDNLLDEETILEISKAEKSPKESYASFSLKFIDEVLSNMTQGQSYHDSLSKLGYFSKYLDMKPYSYLPPLNPSKDDIKCLEKNIKGFNTAHLFYQPLVSPNVKRVISILRRLVNDLIRKYGKIDQIIVETARELNSKKEEDNIKESQASDRKEISEAKKLLEANEYQTTNKNIQRARLFTEQRAKCLYSNDPITLEEALDESLTEVEHFIPRSKIWINSYKNKILVLKKYNQDKNDKHPVSFLKEKNQWEDFQLRVKEYLGKSKYKKIEWLTNEESITKAYENEKLEDRFLNDTRSATKIVANYLEHYLYPKQNEYGKGETNTNVIRVTGRAIKELKYLWGIDKIQPTNEEGKKDRQTNYHHTIDAIVIALLDNSAKKALNDFFKQNENGYKTKAILENLKTRFPKTEEGLSLVDFVKEKVRKYEDNELLVCPMMKKRDNITGFKDGNIKLYWDDEKEAFYQLDKKAIDKSLLVDNNGKDISNNQVIKRIQELISHLSLPKQNNIKDAILEYQNRLLETRTKIKEIDSKIKEIKGNLPNKKEYEETTEILQIKNSIESLKINLKEEKTIQDEPCFFITKKGKKQTIRNIKVKSKDISKVDSLIITDKNIKNRVKRLDIEEYNRLKENKIPFVAKLNDSTLNVDLYNSTKGQIIGLNYFSSIKNNIPAKINVKKEKFISDFSDRIVVQKYDTIELYDKKLNIYKYYTCNGGGEIGGGKNVIKFDTINLKTKVIPIQINENRIIKKVTIDFYGKVSYE